MTRSWIVGLLCFCWAAPSLAQAVIVDAEHRPAEVALQSHRVDAQVQDQVAVVTVEHVFYNPGPRTVEGTFLFPMPPGAQVSRLGMEADGKTLTGEVMAADEARRIYEDIVRRSLDPALLELADYQTLRARVFPIPPNATRTITVRYDATLAFDDGTVTFQYPLRGALHTNPAQRPRPWSRPLPVPTPRDQPISPEERAEPAAPPATESILRLKLEAGTALKNIYSPSHEVEIDQRTNRAAVVTLKNADGLDGRDFILYYRLDERDIGATLLTHRPYHDEPGYFMLLMSPDLSVDASQVQPKDVVFVLDTSGSMGGEKIEQARAALHYALQRLGERDRFGIVSFSTDVEPFRETLVGIDRREEARYFVDGLEARGGTNINDALQRAVALLGGADDGMIIFLTDGLPSVGVTDEGAIRKNVAAANTGGVRLFPFGVGYDVNTRLLDGLAAGAGTFADYISPDENIETRVAAFYEKVRYPVMTDLEMDWQGVRLSALAPGTLPNLYKGGRLILAGRYKTPGKATLTLSGRIDGRTERRRFTFEFPEVERERDFVARLWATRRVGQLLDEIRLHGEMDELRDEVIALAEAYGLVTPYTSYLVLEEEAIADQRQAAPFGQASGYHLQSNAPSPFKVDMLTTDMNATTGAEAVGLSRSTRKMQEAVVVPAEPAAASAAGRTVVKGRTMVQQDDGRWVDGAFDEDAEAAVHLQFGSEAYFLLLRLYPEAMPFARLGSHVTFSFNGHYIQVDDEGAAAMTEAALRRMLR